MQFLKRRTACGESPFNVKGRKIIFPIICPLNFPNINDVSHRFQNESVLYAKKRTTWYLLTRDTLGLFDLCRHN